MCLSWIFSKWKYWIRPLVVIVYLFVLVGVLPYICVQLQQKGASATEQAWFTGGVFVLLALPISIWGIVQHMIHYTKPYLQKHIIRILWMVPIYALNAWLAMKYPSISIYLDTIRECYEGFVIYSFMMFLLNWLERETHPASIEQTGPLVKQIFPLCCLPPCTGGISFIRACKAGILQYTVIRPITTVTALICELCGVYGEGQFALGITYPYILVINNVSQFIAMYSLAMFYFAYKDSLAPMKPLYKFMCIKAVVFFSFFQSVIIAVLVYMKIISSSFTTDEMDEKQIGRSLQDFLICIEMFLASIAHYFAFSYKPFVDLAAEDVNCFSSFMAMWDVSDVTQDVTEHFKQVGNSVKRSITKKSVTDSGESRHLLNSSADISSSSYQSTSNRHPSDGPRTLPLPFIADDVVINVDDHLYPRV